MDRQYSFFYGVDFLLKKKKQTFHNNFPTEITDEIKSKYQPRRLYFKRYLYSTGLKPKDISIQVIVLGHNRPQYMKIAFHRTD